MKKFLSILLASAMAVSLVACGEKAAETEESSVDTPVVVDTPSTTVEKASLDFEDGKIAFAGYDGSIVGGTAESTLSVADFNGSKALKAESTGKNICVAFQADALLGDNVSKVAKVELTLGVDNPSGKFYAVSGKLYSVGADGAAGTAWSVYVEKGNPKRFSVDVADLTSYFAVSLETDNANDAGAGRSNLYIDDICFFDASGNLLDANTAAEFVSASGPDRSYLYNVSGAVEFAGFATSGAAWSQNGFDMPQEILDALVPGSVVEIEYSSTSGNCWVVMPDAAAGWIRVGVGDNDGSGQGYAFYNASRTVAQIPYEQFVEYLGDDVSAWGARMQCESDGDWEVYSIKVGQKSNPMILTGCVEFEGFATTGNAWGQNGFSIPDEIRDALVPGTAIEVTYASASGDMWVVFPDAAAGWSRVGDGDITGSPNAKAIFDGTKSYITYDMIVAICGEDKSAWGDRLQCEASGDWEVYSVQVGTVAELPAMNKIKEFEGFATTGNAWGQNGFSIPDEIREAFVPGSVICITYSSGSGDLWVVFPDAAAGWSRVGDGDITGSDTAKAVFDGTNSYITYDMIVAICGEDTSAWGDRLQCESSADWEVYSVCVGQTE